MKKFTTLALALAVSASAMAATVQEFAPVKAMDLTTVQPAVEKAEKTVDLSSKALVGKSLTTKAVPEGATVKPYYTDPAGTFYPYNTFALDGKSGYILPTLLLPAYTNLQWLNYSYYLDPTSGDPTLAVDDYTWNWAYTDFNGGEATYSGTDLTTMNQPYALKNYPESSYELTNADATLKYASGMPTFGGNGEFLPWFAEANGITNVEYSGCKPFNIFADDLIALSRSGSFGKEANTAGSGWDGWVESLAQQGATNFRVEAMCQTFDKPAAPYALKKLSVMALVNCTAGAQLRFVFFKLDDKGNITNEVVKDYTYTFAEAYDSNTTGYYYEIPVDFTSTDEFGFELDYQLIDCGMAMMIVGYEDEAFTEFDLPVAFYLDGEPTFTVNGYKFWAYCSFDYNGQTVADLFQFPYMFYTDATRTQLMAPTSMNITMEMEYPYLMTYGSYTTGEAYEPAAEHKAYIKSGESAQFGLLCAGKAEDILYTTADGSDIPEWLTIDIADNEIAYDGLTAKGEDVIVTFALAEGLDDTDKSCDIVLSYKGQTQTYKVAQLTSGVEGIAADIKVAPKYYNLQGVEVANPENGLYIVKRGNTVTKEMIVK